MAGVASTFAFKTILFRPSNSISPPSFRSNLFSLRLHGSFIHPTSLISLSSTAVSAVYGSGDDSWSEPDEALGISDIRSDTVRLIDEQQNMVGIVPTSKAIEMAEVAELDLIVLSPDADPPVVRIVDYDKYVYEMEKKKKTQMKKSSANRMDLKELKMGYNIDVHDYSVRLKAAQKFLKEGNKVKIIVNLKGRENEFRNNAIELLRRFQNDIGELAVEESKNFVERNIYMIFVPNKAVLQKAPDPPKRKDKSATSEISAGV